MEFIDPKEWWSRWEGGWEQWEQEPLTEESKTSKKKKKGQKKTTVAEGVGWGKVRYQVRVLAHPNIGTNPLAPLQ